MSTTTELTWNEKYLTGNQDIDDQHKRIFDLLEKLNNQLKNNEEGNSMAIEVVMDLLDYTLKHFIFEENLLELNDYPDLTKHKLGHDMLTLKVMQYKDDIDANKEVNLSELKDFIFEWLTSHILMVDMQYVPYLKEKKS
ncbi:MAG: bacteriohemerythrin [Spirochaetia bacterium]|nr:bacteriohemerythrin [Spirochaetia bacterium]